jgi:hypothetical protein
MDSLANGSGDTTSAASGLHERRVKARHNTGPPAVQSRRSPLLNDDCADVLAVFETSP